MPRARQGWELEIAVTNIEKSLYRTQIYLSKLFNNNRKQQLQPCEIFFTHTYLKKTTSLP